MKKRFVLGFLIVLDYFIGIYLGYQQSVSYYILAVPGILVGLFQGVCIGLLVWGRMEDLSLKNLKLDAFSAVRLVITLVLLVVAHLIAWRWGNYNSFLPYWPCLLYTSIQTSAWHYGRRGNSHGPPSAPVQRLPRP